MQSDIICYEQAIQDRGLLRFEKMNSKSKCTNENKLNKLKNSPNVVIFKGHKILNKKIVDHDYEKCNRKLNKNNKFIRILNLTRFVCKQIMCYVFVKVEI